MDKRSDSRTGVVLLMVALLVTLVMYLFVAAHRKFIGEEEVIAYVIMIASVIGLIWAFVKKANTETTAFNLYSLVIFLASVYSLWIMAIKKGF